MNITKQNETFNLTDTTDVFEMNGGVTCDTFGSLNIYFNVNRVGGDYVGDCNYNKYADNDKVHFGINCSEENREAFTAYADTVVETVLKYLEANN